LPKADSALDAVLTRARACTACDGLPLGPLPLVRAGPTARLLIISQAPGTKAHASGLSFDDPSGDRLRSWLGMDRDVFYDEDRVAIMPMGFCYPGRLPGDGDSPPRPECAPLWHEPILAAMPNVALTLYVGSYAIRAYLPGYRTMTDAIADWRGHGPDSLPLPHPSWRTNAWEKKNPWFTEELLPELRRRVGALGLSSGI
jgi:uracil-DNA glycosylase